MTFSAYRIQGPGGIHGPFLLAMVRPSERELKRLLNHREKSNWARFGSRTRASEWAGARIAIRRLLLEEGWARTPQEICLRKDRLGRPFVWVLSGEGIRTYPCSISHKDGMAAVLMSPLQEIRVGVDLETPGPRAFRIRNAFSRAEDAFVREDPSPENYTRLWTCKEAASKAWGLGLLMNFREITISEKGPGKFKAFHEALFLAYGKHFIYKGYFVALCFSRRRACGL